MFTDCFDIYSFDKVTKSIRLFITVARLGMSSVQRKGENTLAALDATRDAFIYLWRPVESSRKSHAGYKSFHAVTNHPLHGDQQLCVQQCYPSWGSILSGSYIECTYGVITIEH